MNHKELKHKAIIDKFQELLRSGKDYSVESMYDEVGNEFYITGKWIKQIINKHYRDLITQEMLKFDVNSDKSKCDKVKLFSAKFNVCKREAILMLRYCKKRNP